MFRVPGLCAIPRMSYPAPPPYQQAQYSLPSSCYPNPVNCPPAVIYLHPPTHVGSTICSVNPQYCSDGVTRLAPAVCGEACESHRRRRSIGIVVVIVIFLCGLFVLIRVMGRRR
uniref:Transmembrane protein n=1 Tax=Ditylenchus dipsaci TaxID=166011 RepID=A0A915EM72_9BILA